MTLVDTPPKHIYIWVPDNQFSYVFTGSSLANITNDWGVSSGSSSSITYDSSKWIYRAYWNNDVWLQLNETLDLSWITSSMTLTLNVEAYSSGSRAWASVLLCPASATTSEVRWWTAWIQDNSYNLWISANGTDWWIQGSVAPSQTWTLVATWDFSNATASVTSLGRTSSVVVPSWTLDKAKQISTIRICPWTLRIKNIKLERI